MYFHKSPGWLKLLYPGLIWNKSPDKENSLFLTFDDGPIPGVTEFVLDTLSEYKAKATFFCVGDNILKYPSILKEIIAGGHSIGNHTQHHLNGWKYNDEVYLKDIIECNTILDAYMGKDRNRLFRPPYGRIKRSQIKEVSTNHHIIMWDVLSGDFDPNLSADNCLQKTIHYSKNGSIVLFHDSIKARTKVEHVLPQFLEHFSKLSYNFSSL